MTITNCINNCMSHTRKLLNRMFNFSQFNPVSANLYLMVFSSQKFNCLIIPDSSEIAGPIPSSILICDKFLPRKRRISPISFCYTKTANPEFAFCPVRAIPSILIHNTICLISEWLSIRNRFPVFRHRQGNILIIGPDTCLCSSSHSDKLAILCPCRNPLREIHPNPISGKHNRPDRQFLFHGFRPYQKHIQKHRH